MVTKNSPKMAVKVVDDNGNVQPTVGVGAVKVADGQVKASAGALYAVTVAFDGATAGDKIEFVDSLTSTGTSLFTVVAQAADAVYTPDLGPGISFSTGIYYNETKTGGTITTSVVYK